uniref:Uncharacterized protein n=1 Tax=Arundo donax TaxID=35708 RepID=A0A0A8ZWT4_ARUDO
MHNPNPNPNSNTLAYVSATSIIDHHI